MILGSVRSLRAPPAIDGRTYMGSSHPAGQVRPAAYSDVELMIDETILALVW